MINLLDHGYADLIEHWGSDERIIEAARMSTGKGFLGWGSKEVCSDCGAYRDDVATGLYCNAIAANLARLYGAHTWVLSPAGDEKLLRYLYEHKHATPFEMAGMVIEVKAPIFVFREWHRHRTQSYNEMSARYIPLPDENYVPTLARCIPATLQAANRQAAGTGARFPTLHEARLWQEELCKLYAQAQEVYEKGLALGIPKELARLPVPVARYSRMRASANLRNWLAFLTLRCAPQAQWEIREYANAVASLIAERFPRTYELFAKEQVRV